MVAVDLRPGSAGERLLHARIELRRGMTAARVNRPVLPDQFVELFAGKMRQDFFEANVQVIADKAFQIFEFERRGDVRRKHLLDRAADIRGRIQQSSIHVENINRKFRD